MDQWFNPAAFSMPPYGSFGNATRNSLGGPAYANLNVALVKLVRFGGTGQLQLRAEAFNVLDRANFNLPDAFLGSPTFGKILSAQSPRRVQFGVRVVY